MHIGVIGTGYVGLVSGVCFSEFGFNVTCVDKEQSKIDNLLAGKSPIYEPGLDDLLENQIKAGRIDFTTDLGMAVRKSDVVFIAVGTPARRDSNEADLSYVYGVAKEIAAHIDSYKVIVTKSTVPVGTARQIEDIIRKENPNADFSVASNPEFLREGAAINDFMRPDRVVVGTRDERAQKVMRELYRPLYLNETPIIFTKRETAEIIKYAANAFLATKITFINEIADLCEGAGANVQEVAKSLGLDGRISPKFLHAGPGYGGSCFPKDTMALVETGKKYNAEQSIVASVVQANENRKIRMAEKIVTAMGGDVSGKKIAVLGVAFKPNTDDVRDAPSLQIIPYLQERGAVIAAYDPAAMEEAGKILNNVSWCADSYEASQDADAVVILTEWNQFRALDLKRLSTIVKSKTIVDLRNIYKLEDMEPEGFYYVSVGRPDVRQMQSVSIKDQSAG